tara:strand:+ start:70 stop:525 length:456 start_codon:yes stop_codon:yes gene_type:complete
MAVKTYSYDLGDYQGKKVSETMIGESAMSITGGRKLRKAFKDAGDDLSDLKALHKRLADDVAGTAKTKVPVRTGALKASIRGFGGKAKAEVRSGNNRKSLSGVPYAGPIHFGWARRNITPQPFLYEALDDRRQDVIDSYNAEIRHMIRNVF